MASCKLQATSCKLAVQNWQLAACRFGLKLEAWLDDKIPRTPKSLSAALKARK
jgi:hypothetical protein